jgi:hypothetical protein
MIENITRPTIVLPDTTNSPKATIISGTSTPLSISLVLEIFNPSLKSVESNSTEGREVNLSGSGINKEASSSSMQKATFAASRKSNNELGSGNIIIPTTSTTTSGRLKSFHLLKDKRLNIIISCY